MSDQNLKPKKQFTLNIGKWYFAPRLKLTLLAIVLLSILVYLGCWQIGRAHYKEKIFDKLETKLQAAPQKLQDLHNPDLEKDRFTPITVEGLFLNNFTILIDNQMHDHKVGYRVVTPMYIPHVENWLLVDRGWIAANADRKQLPNIELVFGLKSVTGIINTISTGILLKADQVDEEIKWPIVLQSLNYDLISKQLHHPVYDFVLQLNEKQPGSFTYEAVDFGISPAKHLGYALEWFLLAFVVLTYFIIISTKRRL